MSKKAVVLFTVFIDVLGIGVVVPVLPFYVESFGVSAFVVSMLFATYSLFSFFSAPFLGALSDKIGRRPILITSITSTAIGWLIFAAARSVPFLFLGRIIDGLAAGNISTAQSYLVDLSKDEKERSTNIGQIGAIFGIAFIIGPTIGGLLGHFSPSLPFWFVGFLATINAILAYFNLPETHHKRNLAEKININPFKPIFSAFSDKKLLPGFIAFFLFGVAVSIQQSTFALYLDKVFNYGTFVSGMFMTFFGLVLAINQGLLLKRFWLKHFGEPQLELIMLLVLCTGFFLMSTPYLYIFIIGLIGLIFGQSVLRVVMSSQIVGASQQKQGQTLGIMSSIMSLAMIVGPTIGGSLFLVRANFPYIASGLVVFSAFVIVYCNRRKLNKFVSAEETNPNFPI